MIHPSNELQELLGLTANEARVYVHALARPGFTPQSVARDERIPRPTVYHVLQTLIQKGLMTKTNTSAGHAFVPTPPARLPVLIQSERQRLEERERGLAALLPTLQAQAGDAERSDVIRYEGLVGIKLLFEEALYCKERAWDIIAPSQNVLRQVDPAYAEYVYVTQRQRGLRLRTLWENKLHTSKHSPEELRRRQIRLMPKAMTGRFASLVILFDDACAFFPPLEQASATLLRSRAARSTFGALFEGVWEMGEAYPSR